jgi:hypothetical protein
MVQLKNILAGKDSKVISFSDFKGIIKNAGMNWYGISNWTGSDVVMFEEKFDGFTCEPSNDGMKIWDRNFDYSNL